MKSCSISGQGSILAGKMRMVQNNLPRLVGNCATLCLYVGRLGTSQRQVDLDFAHGGDVPRSLVVGEILSIDLVEAGGIASVENNVYIVQFGIAVELELLDAARLHGEKSALAVGLGNLKTARGLLDVDAH